MSHDPIWARRALNRRALLLGLGLAVGLASPLRAAIYPRRLSLRNAHTKESFSGPYRDEWGPLPDALADLKMFLRDHHTNVSGPVEVATVDFLADVLEAVGASRATILSAYRTPETNAKLARTLFGVAERSYHLHGRALDITLDSGLAKAKDAARSMKRGGVGWYPSSHFIHLDTGPLRNWDLGGGGFQKLLSPVSTPLTKAPPKPLTANQRVARLRALARKQFLERKGK